MSAYEALRNNVEYHEGKGNTEFSYPTKEARNLFNEMDNRLKAIDKLQDVVKDLPLKVGDVVHEAGYPVEKGDVIEVSTVGDEQFYKVRIRHRRRTIGYYREELELMERPKA
jgi:hypothetical protein